MKEIPTTWDETIYIDGYPGKYTVIARRHGEQWYIAGVSAEEKPIDLKLSLPMLKGKKVSIYNDNVNKEPILSDVQINNNGMLSITIQPKGGFVVKY